MPAATDTRDRLTITLSAEDRQKLDAMQKELQKQGLYVDDGKVLLGVFRRHGGAQRRSTSR